MVKEKKDLGGKKERNIREMVFWGGLLLLLLHKEREREIVSLLWKWKRKRERDFGGFLHSV